MGARISIFAHPKRRRAARTDEKYTARVAAAVQNADAHFDRASKVGSVLECARPLALWAGPFLTAEASTPPLGNQTGCAGDCGKTEMLSIWASRQYSD